MRYKIWDIKNYETQKVSGDPKYEERYEKSPGPVTLTIELLKSDDKKTKQSVWTDTGVRNLRRSDAWEQESQEESRVLRLSLMQKKDSSLAHSEQDRHLWTQLGPSCRSPPAVSRSVWEAFNPARIYLPTLASVSPSRQQIQSTKIQKYNKKERQILCSWGSTDGNCGLRAPPTELQRGLHCHQPKLQCHQP